jgi:GTPase SAR1 family protein
MSYDSVKVSEVIDGRKVSLAVQDTAGFEVYRSLTNSHYRGADAALFLADVTNKDSLEKLSSWIADAKVCVVVFFFKPRLKLTVLCPFFLFLRVLGQPAYFYCLC